MTTVTLEDAQAQLEIIHRMAPGDELIITEDHQPVAKLVTTAKSEKRLRPPPGLGKGMITVISDDEDHQKDFVDYMPRGFYSIPTHCTGAWKATRG